MLRGDATMVVTIPHDFEASLMRDGVGAGAARRQRGEGIGRGHRAGVRVAASSTDYAAELGRELRADAVATSRTETLPPVPGMARIDVRACGRWYNPTLNYKHYMVPGILVALVTMIGTLLTAQNIAREKETGDARAAQRDADHARPSSSRRSCCRSGCSACSISRSAWSSARSCSASRCAAACCCSSVSAAVYLVVALGIGLWISTLVETQQQAMFVTSSS